MNQRAIELRTFHRALLLGSVLCRCANGTYPTAADAPPASSDGPPSPWALGTKADAGGSPVADAWVSPTNFVDARDDTRVESVVDGWASPPTKLPTDASADVGPGAPADAGVQAFRDALFEARAIGDGPADGASGVFGDSAADSDATAEAQAETSACNPTADPKEAPCVIDDAYGVFVSGSGAEGGAGTMGDPLKTISAGVAKAVETGKMRVYVCRGAYAESLVLDSRSSGAHVYGGLACVGGWKWTGEKAEVRSPSSHYALRVDSTTKPIVIEDLGFSTPDGVLADTAAAGDSSVAAFVTSAAPLTLVRVQLHAGAGANGQPGGALMSNDASSGLVDRAGNPGGAGGIPGAAKRCVCTLWGDSTGGAGGSSSSGTGTSGLSTPDAVLDFQYGLDGLGGVPLPSPLFGCLPGDPGANGSSPRGGGRGAQSLGSIAPSGWSPAPGASGLAGNPGQGGGGGGADMAGADNSGGGGGCGGCGGAGGDAGRGGGGSVALLVFGSEVTLRSAELSTSTGGQGGSGRIGDPGSTGGAGGAGGGGCAGGAGGNGAGGGGGGGGAGGVSIGILSNAGSAVNVDAATVITSGAPGRGGSGVEGGPGTDGAPTGEHGTTGLDGVSLPMLSL